MSKKSNLVTPSGAILTPSSLLPEVHYSKVPKVVGVTPTGSQILVEMLTAQELANTNITITEKTDMKVPMQGYIRATGPGYKVADWGFKVGDRVMFSTPTAVMAPKYDDCHRDRFFMEPHAIRCVIAEE